MFSNDASNLQENTNKDGVNASRVNLTGKKSLSLP